MDEKNWYGGRPLLTARQKANGLRLGIPQYVLDVLPADSECEFIYYADFYYKGEFHQLDLELGRLSSSLGKIKVGLETQSDREKAYAYESKMTGESVDEVSGESCTAGALLSDRNTVEELIGYFKGLDGVQKTMILPYRLSQCSARAQTLEEYFERDYAVEFRNRAWVPVLAPYLNEGGAFIFVGRGHLEEGRTLISYLQKRGYKVERR